MKSAASCASRSKMSSLEAETIPLCRAVAETENLYPLRLRHEDVGESTSPVKKRRYYEGAHPSMGQKRKARVADARVAASKAILDIQGTSHKDIRKQGTTGIAKNVVESARVVMDTRIKAPDESMDVWEGEVGYGLVKDIDHEGSSLDEMDERYAEAVEAGVVGFVPIVGGMFVVEGWSRTMNQGTVRYLLLTDWGSHILCRMFGLTLR